jgi:hypothetical protein
MGKVGLEILIAKASSQKEKPPEIMWYNANRRITVTLTKTGDFPRWA